MTTQPATVGPATADLADIIAAFSRAGQPISPQLWCTSWLFSRDLTASLSHPTLKALAGRWTRAATLTVRPDSDHPGVWLVESGTTTGLEYPIIPGAQSAPARCQCEDWQKQTSNPPVFPEGALICKHQAAVWIDRQSLRLKAVLTANRI